MMPGVRPEPRRGERADNVLHQRETLSSPPVTEPCRRGVASGRIVLHRLTAILTLVMGLTAGACAIEFGSGGSEPPEDQSTRDANRQRNQRFLDEQERTERQRQFDRVGPP